MKTVMMLQNRKRSGAWMLLFLILIGSLCSCRISNSSDNTFYDRADADETGDAYSRRMEAAYDDAFERLMDSEHVEALEGDDLGDKLTRKVLGAIKGPTTHFAP